MSDHIYDVGDLVKVFTADRFKNTETGADIDPDVVSVAIRTPSDVVSVYVYGTDPEVVRDGLGKYYLNVNADEEGTWYYRFWSTGNGQAADEGSFTVQTQQVVPE